MTPADAKTPTPTLAHHLEPGTGHTLTPARALRAVGHYLDRERPVAVEQPKREWPGPWRKPALWWLREWEHDTGNVVAAADTVAYDGAVFDHDGVRLTEVGDLTDPANRRAADAILATICDGEDPHKGSGQYGDDTVNLDCDGPERVELTWTSSSWLAPTDTPGVDGWGRAHPGGAWVYYADGESETDRGRASDQRAARIEVERRLPPHVTVTNPETPAVEQPTPPAGYRIESGPHTPGEIEEGWTVLIIDATGRRTVAREIRDVSGEHIRWAEFGTHICSDDEVYRLTPIAADPDLARTVIALHARLARTEAELGVVTGENLQMRAERSAHKALRRKAEAERDEARRERDIQAETARKMAANVAEATEERDRLARILAARGEVASSLTSDERLPADEMQAAATKRGR